MLEARTKALCHGLTVGPNLVVIIGLLLGACGHSHSPPNSTPDPEPADLSDEVHSIVTSFAEQRDKTAPWPSEVEQAMESLRGCDLQLSQLRSEKMSTAAAHAVYGKCLQTAALVGRWLAHDFEPKNDWLPPSDQLESVAGRLLERVTLIKQVASEAAVTLNLTAVEAAQSQLASAQEAGSDAQALAALHAFRDAVLALQETLRDVEE